MHAHHQRTFDLLCRLRDGLPAWLVRRGIRLAFKVAPPLVTGDWQSETVTIPARPLKYDETKRCDVIGNHPTDETWAVWFVDFSGVDPRVGLPRWSHMCDNCFREFAEEYVTGAVMVWEKPVE